MITHEQKYNLRHYTDPEKGYGHAHNNQGKPLPVYAEKEEAGDSGLLSLVITMFEGNLVHTTSSGLNNVSDLLQ